MAVEATAARVSSPLPSWAPVPLTDLHPTPPFSFPPRSPILGPHRNTNISNSTHVNPTLNALPTTTPSALNATPQWEPHPPPPPSHAAVVACSAAAASSVVSSTVHCTMVPHPPPMEAPRTSTVSPSARARLSTSRASTADWVARGSGVSACRSSLGSGSYRSAPATGADPLTHHAHAPHTRLPNRASPHQALFERLDTDVVQGPHDRQTEATPMVSCAELLVHLPVANSHESPLQELRGEGTTDAASAVFSGFQCDGGLRSDSGTAVRGVGPAVVAGDVALDVPSLVLSTAECDDDRSRTAEPLAVSSLCLGYRSGAVRRSLPRFSPAASAISNSPRVVARLLPPAVHGVDGEDVERASMSGAGSQGAIHATHQGQDEEKRKQSMSMTARTERRSGDCVSDASPRSVASVSPVDPTVADRGGAGSIQLSCTLSGFSTPRHSHHSRTPSTLGGSSAGASRFFFLPPRALEGSEAGTRAAADELRAWCDECVAESRARDYARSVERSVWR